MKNIIFTIIILAVSSSAFAQQEQQYTQFMYNKMGFNPGYVGSHESLCFTGIIRNQWMGLNGAPQTQVLNFHTPLMNQRLGLGMNIIRHTIGISQKITIDGMYAYHIPMANGTLGMGIQTSVRFFENDYTDDDLHSTIPISMDGAIPVGAQTKYVPNFGAGAYFRNDRLYMGFSIPRFLTTNIDFNETGNVIAREKIHAYLMAGYLFDINDRVGFKPQILMKYVKNAPFDADVNFSFIFNKRYFAGITYRVGGNADSGRGESLDLLVGTQITDHLLFGLSYDMTLTELNNHSNGSIEGVVRYCIGKGEGKTVVNPRFF